MSKSNASLLSWNRGIISKAALARVDVDRVRLSAEEMENWMPRTQGSMFLRPGFEYIGASKSNAKAVDIAFVASTDDTALIEITDGTMRVWVDDALVSRASVSTSITTSNFASATGWTESNTGGADCTFGGSGLTLNAYSVGGLALCRQEVTVPGVDQGIRHALNIEVTRGLVTFRCGSTSGGDDYIAETQLRTGFHSLAFTPTGNFWIQFQSNVDIDRIVASCTVAPPGTMELDAPWGENDLSSIRWDQSADVIFVACDGYQQRRIERRDTDSWSVVLYQPDNGPFYSARSAEVKLKVGATFGNTTLTADRPFFKPGHVGSLIRMFNEGVDQSFRLGASGAFTEPFRVTGVVYKDSGTTYYDDRRWIWQTAGTWSGTVRWQRSFDGPETGFKNFRSEAGNTSVDISSNVGPVENADSDNNSIVYYRIGFQEGSYTSGVAVIPIEYGGGGGYGVCRITGYTSSTQVSVEVLDRFNTTNYTDAWQEGIWSPLRGWPSAVTFHRGRLWWAGKSRFVGSVSDDYENFDPDYDGDAGPINRTLGSGPVDTINFMLSLGRPVLGTAGSEYSIKSTSFDEPLTPSNTQAGDPSTQGSREGVDAAKVDGRGVFVQRSGRRAFELVLDANSYEYSPRDLTLLAPDITGTAKFVGIAIQRQPDTRIHFWLSDGTVCVLTYEPDEEVMCWSRISLGGSGFVEHISVLPGEDEDAVYYRVKRTIDGGTVRYIEKMALESECVGGALNKQADSFITYSGTSTDTITGLDHLEGETVVAWGAGKDLGSYTVSSGSITLSEAVTSCVVGLGYEARYKSTKLAYAAQAGTALAQSKRVNFFGAIMRNTHNDGLYYGRSFDDMLPLPRVIDGKVVSDTEVFEEFDEPAFPFDGSWNTDSRLYLKATAPKPCELLAAVLSMEAHEKV